MSQEQYHKEFLDIQEKLAQFLRLKGKLEERRALLMKELRNSYASKRNLAILDSLENICKREERILSYCKKGLANAQEVSNGVNILLKKSESLAVEANDFLHNSEDSSPQSAIQLLESAFSELMQQINFSSANLDYIGELIFRQRVNCAGLKSKIESGSIDGDITKTREFRNMEKLHEKELQIIAKIKDVSQIKRTEKIIADFKVTAANFLASMDKNPTSRKIKEILARNKKLAKIQAAIFPLPKLSTSAFVGGVFGGYTGLGATKMASIFYIGEGFNRFFSNMDSLPFRTD